MSGDTADRRGGGARATARPRAGRRLPLALWSARMQSRGLTATAAAVAAAPATGTIADLAVHRHTLIVTFRRDGTPVATPVWGALAAGAVYVRAERDSGKVKRLRGEDRALLAPCTTRGHALGPALEARGRVLAASEEHVAEDALARRYGTVRALFERTMDAMRVDMCYLEFAPRR